MTRRTRAGIFAVLTFLILLPPAFFVGITLIGHARPFPYVSVWIDRMVLAGVAAGLPALAALGVYRFIVRKDGQ